MSTGISSFSQVQTLHAGVLKVVFATETLAAGVNMPARSTVISALSRRRDRGITMLTHNELLQMAGRAGRRGFDTQGGLPHTLTCRGQPSLLSCTRAHVRFRRPLLRSTCASLVEASYLSYSVLT